MKITYSVDVGEASIQVVHWNPKEFLAIEQVVDLAVNVNVFSRKSGGAAYSLVIRGSDQFGESF